MTELSGIRYTDATLCFPLRGDEVLVAEKQTKIGKQLLNGFGGKMEPADLDIYDTNRREVAEECAIQMLDAKKVGEIIFHNPSDDETLKHMRVHVFTGTKWIGEPTETKTNEMKKLAWHKIADLDYSLFLAADRLFLPQILGGKCVKGFFEYDDNWTIRKAVVNEVPGF